MSHPLFQHRHYCKIAAIIAAIDNNAIREHVADHFARYLCGTNPQFNVTRFENAALGEPLSGRDKVRS